MAAVAAPAYEWVENRKLKLDPNVVGAEVERIKARDGVCAPSTLQRENWDPGAPLYAAFETDPVRALDAHRTEQARLLIRSLRVVGTNDAPAFVHLRVTEVREGYVSQEDLRSNLSYYEFALAEARKALLSVRFRYGNLRELEVIWDVIDDELDAA